VFLDCPGRIPGCDFDYFRTEVTFVSYVSEREAADVHILITTQPTGGGGREYTVTFLGLGRFAGATDTLRHVAAATETEDEVREGLARVLRLGLVRYVARTSLAARLDISGGDVPQTAAPGEDRWNYWVFRSRFSGNFSGERSASFAAVTLSQSADRVTDRWKIGLRANWSYSEGRFKVSDKQGAETITSIRRSTTVTGLIARSRGPHWSVGARLRAGQSTFHNEDAAVTFAPTIEFSRYPYGQSTRRAMTVRYEIGLDANDYRDTTVFDKTSEILAHQSVTGTVDFKQPWGSVEVSLEAQHYLQDIRKHHVTLFADLELRITRGLSVNLVGEASRVQDRVSVARVAGSKRNDVLLQLRQLDTDFEFFSSVGFTFRFGSVFDNVVNPRFGSIAY
jgi:hypothetical protein